MCWNSTILVKKDILQSFHQTDNCYIKIVIKSFINIKMNFISYRDAEQSLQINHNKIYLLHVWQSKTDMTDR